MAVRYLSTAGYRQKAGIFPVRRGQCSGSEGVISCPVPLLSIQKALTSCTCQAPRGGWFDGLTLVTQVNASLLRCSCTVIIVVSVSDL